MPNTRSSSAAAIARPHGLPDRGNPLADTRFAQALPRAVANTVDAAVLSFTPDLDLTYANTAAAAISGYSLRELLATPGLWASRLHPEDLEARHRALSVLAADSEAVYDYRMLTRTGDAVWIHERLRLVRDVAHDPVRIDAIAVDDSARAARDRQLHAALDHATQFRRVFEISNVLGAVADFDGGFQLLSAGWRSVMGYAPERLVGTRLLELVHPDDVERTATEALLLMTTGVESRGFEARFRCRDGSYRWLFWNMSADVPARRLYGVAHDVTERRIMEEALRGSEERLRALASQVPGCIYQIRQWPDGRREFTYLSDGIVSILGVEPEDIYSDQGLPWSFIPPDELDAFIDSMDDSARALQPWVHDFRVRLSSGEEKGIHGHAQPRREPDGSIQWSGLLTDVTDLQKQEAELIRTREAALEASREKSRFLANMSHEIRTPMNGILGMTALALSTQLSAEQREYLEAVRVSAESLLSIINDILDISKIEAQRMAVERVPFTLRRVVEEVAKMSQPKAAEKELALAVHIDDAVPARVVGDPVRFAQILRNLVANAVKFTESGGVTVTVAPDQGDCLRLSVSDTGPGIPADLQPAIFEAFRQADESTTRRYGGTGLGLSISRELAVLMGGSIWVESEPGHGATFHCVLPLQAAAPGAPLSSARLPVETGPLPQLDLHLLVVEDNVINARVVTRMLQKAGCTVELADSGPAALELLLTRAYDLVLMDVQMPELDGLEVTRRLRTHEQASGAHVPIVALTANAMKGDEDRCREAGMDGYLSKPIATEALIRELRRVSGR